MTTKSREGQRRDKHPPSADAVHRKAKKAKRAEKEKYQTKLQGAQRRDGQARIRNDD